MKKVAKNLLNSAIGLSLLMTSCGVSTNKNTENMKDEFKLGTGVNVSHWLSQSSLRGKEREQFITEKDFKTIADLGFDHVRLPIDEVQIYDTNLNRHEDAFALMKNAIEWTLKNDMNIIIDLHITRSHNFNKEEENTLFKDSTAQTRLIEIWKDLQQFLKSYPNDRLAYELLNEAVAPTHEDLNKLEARLIEAIRKEEPNRFIVVGSNWQQSVETIQYLKVPQNDKHLILSFHYYNPFLVTHYGTSWTPLKDFREEVTYPGLLVKDTSFYSNLNTSMLEKLRCLNTYWNKDTIANQIKPAIEKGKEFGLQVYCGEFGAYPFYINKDSRINWYKDICAIFQENNIANAHWCYKGDFPIVNPDNTPNELPEILIKK